MATDKLLVKHKSTRQKTPKLPKPPKTYKLSDLTQQQRDALDWYLSGIERTHGPNSSEYRYAKKRVDYILIRQTKKIGTQKKIMKNAGKAMGRVIEHDSLYPGQTIEGIPDNTSPEQIRRYQRELETLFKQYKKRR